MPRVPLETAPLAPLRLPRRDAGYQPSGLEYVGRGLQEVSHTFQQVQYVADKSEGAQSSLEGAQEFKNILQDTAIKVPNRDDFKTEANARITEAYQRRLEAATSQGARAIIQRNLANELVQHKGIGGSIDQAYWTKTIEGATQNYIKVKNQAIIDAASDNPEVQAKGTAAYAELLGNMTGSGYMKAGKAEEEKIDFDRKRLSTQAENKITTDPSKFLRELEGSEYNAIADRRFELRRTANAALSAQYTRDERDQRIKREQADREIQVMFDEGAPAGAVTAKLKELSGAGILSRTEREFWDNKLLKGEKTDDPAQAGNEKALKAEFQGAGYPTPGRINEYRARAKSMLATNDLGVLGWGAFNAYLSGLEQSLRAEGRAEESAARARTTFAERGGAGGGKPPTDKDITKTDGLDIIKQNYPYSTPQYQTPQHKKDVAEYTRRTLENGERKDVVAKDIAERGRKIKEDQAKQRKIQTDAAQADPKNKELLDRLNVLKGGKK